MARDSTVSGDVFEGDYVLSCDGQVDELRSAIWSTIHEDKGDLPWADVAFALSIVQYELMHHADEFDE
jgi:hypothetical protein